MTTRRTANLPHLIRIVCLLVLLPGISARAQFGTAEMGAFKYPAETSAQFDSPVAFIGETVRLDVTVDVLKGHYLYSMNPLVDPEAFGPFPTTVEMDLPEFLEVIEGETWTEPPPKVKLDKGFETEVRYHTGKVVFSRLLRVVDVDESTWTARGAVRKQICDDSSCLPPRASPFSADILVRRQAGQPAAETDTTERDETPAEMEEPESASAREPEAAVPADAPEREEAKPEKPVPGNKTETQKLAEHSLAGLAGLAFVAGLLSLLTPCVFPMIPITISFFTKRASKTKSQRIGLCSVYAGSIVIGFAVIGFGLALALRVFGFGSEGAGAINQFAANPWLNLVITGVFVFFALSLFGAFEIGLPTGWANKLQKKQGGRTDALGAFFMAMIFVIVSFTCTAPIVGPLIVLTFEGRWFTPFVGLTAYALGFALPFFFLGLVPGAVASLPKSGSWLNATKVTMGLIEMAAAFKFLSNTDLVWRWNIFTREVVLAAWAAIAVIICIYLLGIVRMEKDGDDLRAVGPVRLCFSMAFGTLALYLAFGLFAGRLHAGVESFLPPTSMNRQNSVSAIPASAHGPEEIIVNDLELARRRARSENKPLFVDFTGWTCTNCRLNEIKVFPAPGVKELMDRYVVVQLYTDDLGKDEQGLVIGEKYQRYQSEVFGTFSLPFYATFTPDGDKVATYGGLIRDPGEFKTFLALALDRTG